MTTAHSSESPAEPSEVVLSWEERFVQLLETRRTPDRPGRVIGVRGATSLEPLQDVCNSWRRRRVYRSARYRLGQPSLGSLLAAFVADLDATTSRQPDPKPGKPEPDPSQADPTIGDLRDGRSPGWTPLEAGGKLAELTEPVRWRATGTLSPAWQRSFFEVMDQALGSNERLVLFAELDGRPDDHWTDLEAVARYAGTRVWIVVTWPWPDAMPSWMNRLELPPGPRARVVADYADTPLTGDELAELDTLDRQWYAAALANLVMLPGTGPMTIGIHGRWGTGKSSFMRFVRRELVRSALPESSSALVALDRADARVNSAKNSSAQQLEYDDAVAAERRRQLAEAIAHRSQLLDRLERAASGTVLCVRFNAWLYEGATQIWAGLTHEITQVMEQSLPWWRRLRVRIGYAMQVNGPRFWLGAAAGVVLAMLVAGLVLLLGNAGNAKATELPPGLDVVANLLPAGSVVAIGLLLAWRFSKGFVPVSSRVAEYLRQPDYREHMGYQHEVRRDIEFLEARLPGRPRIVVFVDDLDRCSDERVLETLQAINLLLNESGFYVFLGIDTEMIIKAIERWYQTDEETGDAGDTAERARSYLDKILQLNVPLRELGSDQAFTYLSDFFSQEAVREFEGRVPTEAPADDRFEPVDQGELRWQRDLARRPPVYDFQVRQVEDTGDELAAFGDLRAHLMPNPRELKRLLNVHRLVRLLARQSGWRPGPAERRLIIGWLLYCFVRPDAAAALVAAARKNPAGVVHDEALAEFVTDPDDAEAAVLTNEMLQPGQPLGETWEIAALFRRHTATRPAATRPTATRPAATRSTATRPAASRPS